MTDSNDQALMRAYELIEDDRLSDAEALLKPILEQEPDNIDAWWLYAHAVSDPETARMALSQVLKLDHNYEGAQDLLNQLDEGYPAAREDAAVTPVTPPPTLPSLPDDEDIEDADFLADFESVERTSSGLDEEFSLDDMADTEDETPERQRNRSPLLLILFAVLLVVIVVIVMLLANPFQQEPAVTPTQQAAAPTVLATEDAEVVNGDAVSADVQVAVLEALADQDTADNSVEVMDTSLGNTLLVGVCTTAGEPMRSALTESMAAFAGLSDDAGAEYAAIGVKLVDCETNSVLRVIAVPVADASAFTAGDLDDAGFEARWVAAA